MTSEHGVPASQRSSWFSTPVSIWMNASPVPLPDVVEYAVFIGP